MAHFKIIDLFAGIGGIRLGLEMALKEQGHTSECVFTSEIKTHAISVLKQRTYSKDQKRLLNILLTERRKKQWADIIGIDWMDGMPLTKSQIETFYHHPELETMLEDLTNKGYLKFEYPKKRVSVTTETETSTMREYDETKPKGYNIVAGKLSFEISKILDLRMLRPH